MNNYYVIEIQTNAEMSGNFVFGFADKGSAEDKFIALRAAARQSFVLVHTIIWVDKNGNMIEKKSYVHPAPAPTPEPEAGEGE